MEEVGEGEEGTVGVDEEPSRQELERSRALADVALLRDDVGVGLEDSLDSWSEGDSRLAFEAVGRVFAACHSCHLVMAEVFVC